MRIRKEIRVNIIFLVVQDMLVYIAKEGVATADVFRRPGNPNDIRRIVKRLSEGRQVIYPNYSFYTLASVVKVSDEFYKATVYS